VDRGGVAGGGKREQRVIRSNLYDRG
jgi:hypothetical protein